MNASSDSVRPLRIGSNSSISTETIRGSSDPFDAKSRRIPIVSSLPTPFRYGRSSGKWGLPDRRRYLPETSATVFRMFSEVMSEMPYKVFVFPVRDSSTTTEGVPATLNLVMRVLKYCIPATTSA